MFLRRLAITNIRSIADADVSFRNVDNQSNSRRWTIFLGENGCGKSTILRALALVMAGSNSVVELLGSPDTWIRNKAKSARIEATIATAEGEEREIALHMRRGQNVRQILKDNAQSLELLDAVLEHTTRNYLTLGYGVSRRLSTELGSASASKERFHSPRSRSVATMFDPDVNLVSIEAWAMDLDYRRGARGMKIIRDVFDGLLPDVEFKGIDREQRQLQFQTRDGIVPLRQLSDGYQNMISWIGDLLYQITETFDDYRQPLRARGLLLLDELGLHLHPKWQRNLIDYLSEKLPNMQFVTTTHSPLTAHQAGEGELFFLDRNGKGGSTSVHPFAGTPNLMLLHQLILSPAFGIETAQSAEVEQMQREYSQLKAKKRHTAADRKKLEKLTKELEEVTSWGEETPKDKKISSLLERIDQRMQQPVQQ